ncbi:MAG: GNAT family N-acetyltransferase [Clostridia bacterium]|nr:GNAT family N-acetyltransferase [Clostridia bacterium]
MVELKAVTQGDKKFWLSMDGHCSEDAFNNRVISRTGFLILSEGEMAGVICYNMFWDNLPFLPLIKLLPEYRGCGNGREAMRLFENMLKERGFNALLLSTQADEQAQHFYRKIGYKECGCLVLDEAPLKQPMEIFFIKKL